MNAQKYTVAIDKKYTIEKQTVVWQFQFAAGKNFFHCLFCLSLKLQLNTATLKHDKNN